MCALSSTNQQWPTIQPTESSQNCCADFNIPWIKSQEIIQLKLFFKIQEFKLFHICVIPKPYPIKRYLLNSAWIPLSLVISKQQGQQFCCISKLSLWDQTLLSFSTRSPHGFQSMILSNTQDKQLRTRNSLKLRHQLSNCSIPSRSRKNICYCNFPILQKYLLSQKQNFSDPHSMASIRQSQWCQADTTITSAAIVWESRIGL